MPRREFVLRPIAIRDFAGRVFFSPADHIDPLWFDTPVLSAPWLIIPIPRWIPSAQILHSNLGKTVQYCSRKAIRARCQDVCRYKLEKHKCPVDAHHPWPKRTSAKG
jgi:hypothetical protein